MPRPKITEDDDMVMLPPADEMTEGMELPPPPDDELPPPPEEDLPLPPVEKPVKKPVAVKKEKAPEKEAEEMISDNSGMEEEQQQNRDVLDVAVSSSDCSFTIDSKKFVTFLEKILLSNIIEDAYVSVRKNSLFCAYVDNKSAGLYGFIAFEDGVKTSKEGAFIITNIKKLKAVMGQFEGAVQFSYTNSSLHIVSQVKSKKVQLLGNDEGFVTSMRGVKLETLDFENYKIGSADFSGMTNFQVSKETLSEIVAAANSIELTSYSFNVGSDAVGVRISNEQDIFNIAFTATQLENYDSPVVASFLLSGMKEVLKNCESSVKIWISSTVMIMNSGKDYYMFIGLESI